MSRTGLFVVCPDTEKDYTLKGAALYFMMAMLVVICLVFKGYLFCHKLLT